MNTAILLAALLLAQTEPAQGQPTPTEPTPTEPAPTASAQSEAPWFYTQVIVPLGVGAIGSLVTLGIGIWQIKRTEWYRRASRWEPYAEQVWQARQKAYEELYREYWALTTYAKIMLNEVRGKSDASERTALVDSFIDQIPEVLYGNQGKTIIASQKATKSLERLIAAYCELIAVCENGIDDAEPHHTQLNTALKEFANALRKDLRVDPLDTHFSEAMRALESLDAKAMPWPLGPRTARSTAAQAARCGDTALSVQRFWSPQR